VPRLRLAAPIRTRISGGVGVSGASTGAISAITMTGPTSGTVSVASTAFTISANGPVGTSIVVTMSDAANGGTFKNSGGTTITTVTLTTGSPSQTFTYTPATTGAKTISVTSNPVLTYPASITYTSNAASDIIPTARLIDWTASGVSGGIPTRTTLAATISTAGGNDSTSNTTTIQNAINAAASGSVVLIPPGIYLIGSLDMKSGVTLRGAGEWCKSTSNVAIGTGTKVFTVPTGLGYVSGIQVRVWRNGDRGYYMQGSVTSYSGDTLTLSIASSNGSGTYADWRVSLTVLKATSGTSTYALINFGSSGVSSPTTGTNKVISSGATRGSTQVVTTSAGPTVTTGQYLVITETNNSEVALWGASNTSPGATWADGWSVSSGQRARGQIVKVTNVSGTTTQTLTFTPALFTDYPNTPWATPFSASVDGAGLENMQLFGASNDSHNALVGMQRAVGSWVRAVDFDMPSRDGFFIAWGFQNDIDSCHIYDGFGVDNNYRFNRLVHKTTLSRVVNCIVERSVDSIMLEWGAAGNVIAYNYTLKGYNPVVRSFLVKGITMNHGAHPQFNLVEGNVVTNKICADSTWGSSSDSLIYRNAIFGFEQSRGPDNARTIDATTYNETQVNYAIDLWEGQIRYAAVGNIIGNTGNWASKAKVRKPTYPTSFDYDTTAICIALGKDSDGLAYTPILTSPASTFIDHGNYDVVTAGQVWDGSISNHTLLDSYCYAAKPSWWDDAVTWPPINPASPGTLANATVPARYRYDNGISASPTISYSTTVSTVGDFENSSDGVLMTTALVRAAFKGLQASSWDTTPTFTSTAPGSVSNVFFEVDAARNPGQTLSANGTLISATSNLGMRCVMNTDGCLILTYQHIVSPRVGFFFRFNGAQINSSPRDVAMLYSPAGHFQGLQIYDGATPYFHCHHQPNTGSNTGNDVTFSRDTWYWVEFAWVDGGNTFSVSFYNPATSYSLVGTSSGAITGTSTVKPRWFGIGALQYTSGGSQSVDFDNIILNFDGTAIPRPTS
jgi:hypothetical protein